MIVSAGLMTERAGEPGFADAGRADDDQVLLLLDPATQGEILEQRAVKTAIGTIVDILDNGSVSQPGVAQARRKATVLTVEPVAQDRLHASVGAGANFQAAQAGGLKAITPYGRASRRMPRQARKPCSGCGRLSRISAVHAAVESPIAAGAGAGG